MHIKVLVANQVLILSMLSFLSADPIEVDPGDRLVDNSQVVKGLPPFIAGEWNTAGNYEGWTLSGFTNSSVSGGVLMATATVASPFIQLAGFTGPDLDFGYFDWMQIRLQLPVGFNDDVQFSYGTSDHSGFSATRKFLLPAAQVASDGAWHTYRIDLGYFETAWWRETLTDLQIKPLGNSGSGLTFSIDYVEIGDIDGDVWERHPETVQIPNGCVLEDLLWIESKHATYWWCDVTYDMFPAFDPDAFSRRNLRILEDCYDIFAKHLNMTPPGTDIDGSTPGRYKTNYVTYINGAAAGAPQGFGRFHVTPSMGQLENVGNATQHEYAHVFQMHNRGNLAGGHWESHANFLREVWASHLEEVLVEKGYNTGIFNENKRNTLEWSNYRQDWRGFLYHDYRIHFALLNYAEAFGTDWDTVTQLWSDDSTLGLEVYNKLDSILEPSLNMKDLVAFCMRHWPFLDFAEGQRMKASSFWKTADDQAWFKYLMGSHLIPCQDKPGWWRVPFERAPQKYAFMLHELEFSSSNVTVEVAGFDLVGSGEGWCWTLAATDDNWENVRYSNVYAPGTQSFALQAGETRLFLMVFATPDNLDLRLKTYYNLLPEDKHEDRLRYAYEVRLVNAQPAISARQIDMPGGSGQTHVNGGGWVANSATVDATAYVGPNARVLNSAKVYGNARIEDYAVIMDNATVQNHAVVSGHAVVLDNALVEHNARVRDRAYVRSSARVGDDTLVEDYARVHGQTVSDQAIIRGSSVPGAPVSGTAITDFDYRMGYTLTDGVHFNQLANAGNLADFSYYAATQTKPRGLVASYRFEAPDGDIGWDEFGAQHALLRGSPARVTDGVMSSPVLRLNGVDQYLVLDRSVCDLQAGSFSLWCKPDDNTNRPLLYLGGSDSSYIELRIKTVSTAEFTIDNGSSSVTLVSATTIPDNSWTCLTVTLDGNQARLYIGGVLEDSASTSLVPRDVMGSNDYAQAEAYYIGRDWSGNLYAGDLEDVRFYNVALSSDEVANEMNRSGNIIAARYVSNAVAFSSPAAGHDYLTDGFTGTIWDGLYYDTDGDSILLDVSAGTDALYPGTLRMAGRNGNFNHQGTDAPFLYIDNIAGDFVATVQIPAIDVLNYNEAGIMARVADVAAAGAGEDFIQARRKGWGNPTTTQMRSLDNGVRSDSGTDPDNEWIRLERVGNVFTMSHSSDGIDWTVNTSRTRNDLAGLALQVGLFNAGYSGGERTANFDHFVLVNGTTTYADDFGASDGVLHGAQSGIRDGRVRVLEASIYPHTSGNSNYYEAVFDSTDENGGGYQGSGLGLDNGEIKVRLENVGFWNTGVNVALNQWQKVTLAYDGSKVTLYIDDIEQASRTYSTNAEDIAGKNFRIGFAMSTNGTSYYFDGLIKDVFIYDQMSESDTQAPTPNPEYAIVPAAASATEVTMTAITGSDANGPVEYYFKETTDNPGGSDSGWQTSPLYMDTELTPMTTYGYQVKMRDNLGNQTAYSVVAQALTGPTANMVLGGLVDVNVTDFAQLSAQWQETGCETSQWCAGTDLDLSGDIGIGDLLILAAAWLGQ